MANFNKTAHHHLWPVVSYPAFVVKPLGTRREKPLNSDTFAKSLANALAFIST